MAEIRKGLHEMTDIELDVEQHRRRAAFQRALSEVVRRDPDQAFAILASFEADVHAILSAPREPERR